MAEIQSWPKNATFLDAVFVLFGSLKSNIQYNKLIRTLWTRISPCRFLTWAKLLYGEKLADKIVLQINIRLRYRLFNFSKQSLTYFLWSLLVRLLSITYIDYFWRANNELWNINRYIGSTFNLIEYSKYKVVKWNDSKDFIFYKIILIRNVVNILKTNKLYIII